MDNLAIISAFSSILSITSICGLAFFSRSLNAAGAIDSVSLFQGPVRRKEARGEKSDKRDHFALRDHAKAPLSPSAPDSLYLGRI